MKKKFGYAAFAALILALCLVPSVGMFFAGQSEAGGNEVLASLPSLRDHEGKLNTGYLNQLTDYVEDNYFLRPQFVTAWSALNQRVLRTSIADNVLLGRNGWLYFADTLGDYTGSELLDGREVFSAVRNLALMEEYCQSQGVQFLFAIAPNKNTVYPEHMPALPVFSQENNRKTLGRALTEAGVSFLDLSAAFESQREVLYFTQDSHWNSKGAALAADWINTALYRGAPRYFYGGSFTPAADHRSDLYDMLCPTGTWLETDQKYDGKLVFDYDAPIRSAENMTIMTTGQGRGSLLMFRDSFGNLLYPYLADSFAHALFSRATDYRLNLIQEREAEYVVVELVERNLDYLLQNVPVMPAPVREAPAAGRELEDSLVLEGEASKDMEGYVLLRGTLPAEAAEDSAVLLCTSGACYEAFLLEKQGFALYLPQEALAGGELSLTFTAAEGAVSLPAVYEESAV